MVSAHGAGKSFSIYVLKTLDPEKWNLCYLRPGVYHQYFEEHKVTEMYLDFQDEEEVVPFIQSLQRLRLLARGGVLTAPTSPTVSTQGSFGPPANAFTFSSMAGNPPSGSVNGQAPLGEGDALDGGEDDGMSIQPSLPRQGPPRGSGWSIWSSRQSATTSGEGSKRGMVNRWLRS